MGFSTFNLFGAKLFANVYAICLGKHDFIFPLGSNNKSLQNTALGHGSRSQITYGIGSHCFKHVENKRLNILECFLFVVSRCADVRVKETSRISTVGAIDRYGQRTVNFKRFWRKCCY